MPNPLQKNDDTGFVDVAANALAIVILVTMIALLLTTIPQQRGEQIGDTRPALPFPVALDPTQAPFNAYWYVTGAGMTRIDLDPVAQAIARGDTKAETPQGSFYFQNGRRSYRDLDEYRLDLLPNLPELEQSANALNEETLAEVVRTLLVAFQDAQTVPTFFVTAEGHEAFSKVYHALRDEDVALRWRAVDQSGTAILLRSDSQFETGLATWR